MIRRKTIRLASRAKHVVAAHSTMVPKLTYQTSQPDVAALTGAHTLDTHRTHTLDTHRFSVRLMDVQ
jgi:hypothetical protein